MRLELADDFDAAMIADSGQCFRWTPTDDGFYRVIHGGLCVYMKKGDDGFIELDCTDEEFDGVWREYLDTDEKYFKIRAMIDRDADPWLFEASENEKGIRILRQDPFEALISFIISQNRNIPAIRRSIELICERRGEKKKDRRGEIFYTFPTPEALADMTEEELKECRLGYRCGYIKKTAMEVASGSLDLNELKSGSDEEIMKRLTGLYGVGAKVASCALLFGFHHLDAFPVDVWIKRILERVYPEGYDLERYRPYNGVMQQYMFAHARHGGL